MAEQNVVIKIQADVSKATNDVKALQQVIAKLSTSGTQAAAGTEKVSNAAKKTATASQLLDKEIKKVIAGQGNLDRVAELATQALDEQTAATQRLADVSKAVEGAVGKQGAAVLGANKQIGGLADASGAASFALLSLGQAFQDSAQFGMGFAQGFRAINNNIQQTFTAIALGSIQAGGFNNLLKLMGGSLWGPGGLILGFSAVTAGIEFFSTRAQKAKKEAEELSNTFADLAEVIPTRNVRSFLVTQMSLEKQAASLRSRISELSNETVMIGTNYGVITRQTEAAKEETANLQLELDDINKALEDINKSGPEYIEWLKSIDGLQALSAKTAQDFQVEIANLEAQVAMSGEFGQFEERIAALRNVIASGLGFDFKDPDVAIAEFEKRYAAFSSRLSEIGIEISRSKFAKIFKDGEAEEFFSEQYKEFVTRRMKETIRVARELQEVADSFMAPEQLVSAAEQRMEEIQRSSTLVGRMQGVQGIQPEELQQISPEAQAEVDAIGQAIEDQNRQGTDSWMTHWSRRTEATLQSAQIMQQAIGSIGSTFMQLAQTGDKSNKRLFETGKKLAIAQALISTYVGFTKALEQGGPLGVITGASVLAAGMAKVAAIRATKMNGGGGGGGSSAARGISSAPTFFTSFGNISEFPASNVASLSAASTSGTNISLVVQGRNLVGVIENEMQASSRRIGYSTGVFSGALASSSSTRDVFGGIK